MLNRTKRFGALIVYSFLLVVFLVLILALLVLVASGASGLP